MINQKISFDKFREESFVCIDSDSIKLSRVKDSKGTVSQIHLVVSCKAIVYNDIFKHLGGIDISINQVIKVLSAIGSIERKKLKMFGIDVDDSLEDRYYIPIDNLTNNSVLNRIEEIAIEEAYNKLYRSRNEFNINPLQDKLEGFFVTDSLDIRDTYDLSNVEVFNIPSTKHED